MNREELLGREDEAWRRFAETAHALPADRRNVEGVVPGWFTISYGTSATGQAAPLM